VPADPASSSAPAGGGSEGQSPPGTSHGGRYAKPTPKLKASPPDANQALVDNTAQSKAAGAPPAEGGTADQDDGPAQPAYKPPTPPRPRPALKRKRPGVPEPANPPTAVPEPANPPKKKAARAPGRGKGRHNQEFGRSAAGSLHVA